MLMAIPSAYYIYTVYTDKNNKTMKSINIIAIMPFLASSFMTQAPVYQDVNHPIGNRVVGVWKTNSKQESHVS